MTPPNALQIAIPQAEIDAFCRKWKVAELSLFGSAARGEATPKSDVDLLVRFDRDMPWDLFDWVDMIDELKEIFARDVDLVDADAVRNPIRKAAMLADKFPIYVA